MPRRWEKKEKNLNFKGGAWDLMGTDMNQSSLLNKLCLVFFLFSGMPSLSWPTSRCMELHGSSCTSRSIPQRQRNSPSTLGAMTFLSFGWVFGKMVERRCKTGPLFLFCQLFAGSLLESLKIMAKFLFPLLFTKDPPPRFRLAILTFLFYFASVPHSRTCL